MQWPPTSPGRNGKKFHFVPAASQYFHRVDADPVEDERQFVHQRNVQISLRVFDHLGGLGNHMLDAR